jgi:alkaline phosphatase
MFLLLYVYCSAMAQTVQPKNIIIMIGDGMGYEHINAALYYNGNSQQNIWQSFPVQLAASTGSYNIEYSSVDAWSNKDYVSSAYTESSAASTAIATSVITSPGMIGMSPDTLPMVNPVQLAFVNGKSSGVVTSVPFCHATPAGFSSHNESRSNYDEIAFEMLVHSPLTLIMGAGHPWYNNDGKKRDSANYTYVGTRDVWNSIISGLKNCEQGHVTFNLQDIDGDGVSDEWFFSDNLKYLNKQFSDGMKIKRLFYLAPVFETLQSERSDSSASPWGVPYNESVPSLKDMSLQALEFLSGDPEGFFLMIEGGAIDWAAHDNDLARLIEEQTEFEKTVEAVVQWISEKQMWDETLLIVLADHETGYLCRGFDEQDGFIHIIDNGKGVLPGAVFLSDNHTNHLVPFFARGSASHVFEMLATWFDPVRGPYLHSLSVGHVIKYLWGDAAFAYPTSVVACNGKQVNLVASAPFPACSYQWIVNGEVLKDADSPFLKTILIEDSELYCLISCAGVFYKTNTVQVRIQNCNQ